MRNFKPVYCGPMGWSDINNAYVEDKVSGGFFVLNATSLLVSMPMQDENTTDYFCNRRLLMSLVAEVVEWIDGLRDSNPSPIGDFLSKGLPEETTDFSPGTYSDRSHLYVTQDEVSGSTIVLTNRTLIVTMPIVTEDGFYFVNEHRLMRLAGEALAMLRGQSDQQETERKKKEAAEIIDLEAAD